MTETPADQPAEHAVTSPLRQWLTRHKKTQAWLNVTTTIGTSLVCRYCLPSDALQALAPDARNSRRIYEATLALSHGGDPLRAEDWFPYQAHRDKVRALRKEQLRLAAIGAQ